MARRARLGFVLWCIIAPAAHGLGLGDIDLKSALNQPLSAEIGLVSATPEELGNLKVELAGRETFDRYGIDRPEFLGDLTFRVGKDGRGRDIVRVTSTRAITEPFVTMLVEATWPRGRLLREYTVLLDPPVLLPQQAAQAPVQAPQAAPQPSRQIQRQPTPQPSAPAPSRAMPRPAPAPAPAPAASNPGTYGPVQRNQTLWGIATQLAPAGGATVNQMMVSLYRANPEAFDGNINRLRRGAVLRVPGGSEIADLSVSQATAEVRRQNESFAGAAPAPEPRLRLREPTAADAAAPTTGSGSASTTGSSAADRAEISRLRDEVEERDRLISVQDAELQALQEELERLRAAAGEADAGGEMDVTAPEGEDSATPGVDLSSEEIFAEEETSEVDPAGADATGEEAAVDDQAPAQPATQVVTTVSEEGLLDQILGFLAKPLAWIIGGVIALGLLGFVVVKRRGGESAEDITGRWDALEAETDEDPATRDATERMRRKAMEDDSFVVEEPSADFSAEDQDELLEDIAEATGSHQAVQPAEPASVNLDETLSSQTAINLDQADPVAEADFHMAYGLYDQAADLLGKALESAPDRRDLKLKLIEVFFVWGNKDAFLEAARGFREEIGSGSDTDWDKITIMGKQLCPGEELFAGTVDPSATMIDMDLDAGDSPALDFSLDDTGESKVDLDLASDEGEDQLESADTLASTSGGLDGLDIGAQTAAGLEAVFDLDEGGRADEEVDLDLSDTVESPTLETPLDDSETVESPYADPTVESPTLENISADAPTMETPTIETPAPDAPTVETPTLESEGGELPTVEQPALRPAEQTAEIDLDDLGLDLEGLDDLSSELDDIGDTREQPQVETPDDDDLLSATGVTQVLGSDDLEDAHTEVLTDDDATMMAPGVDPTLTGATEALNVGEDGIDLDLDDLSAALEGGETVEQPAVSSTGAFSRDVFGGESESEGSLDLDVGTDHAGRDDPTATEEVGHMDPQTMTEVGTKLDLARAYIDMGDPEGARSILNEVLEEGDTTQQDEARTLMSGLG